MNEFSNAFNPGSFVKKEQETTIEEKLRLGEQPASATIPKLPLAAEPEKI